MRAWNVRERIFITSETWIGLPPNLRSRNKIKLFRLHRKSKNRKFSISVSSLRRSLATHLNSVIIWVRDNDPICVWNCDVVRMFLCAREEKSNFQCCAIRVKTLSDLQVDPRHYHTSQICQRTSHQTETPWHKRNWSLVWIIARLWLILLEFCDFLCRKHKWIPLSQSWYPMGNWIFHQPLLDFQMFWEISLKIRFFWVKFESTWIILFYRLDQKLESDDCSDRRWWTARFG